MKISYIFIKFKLKLNQHVLADREKISFHFDVLLVLKGQLASELCPFYSMGPLIRVVVLIFKLVVRNILLLLSRFPMDKDIPHG